MRFVFTAPRFHTNQRYAFRALLDAGHEVTMLVLRRGPGVRHMTSSSRGFSAVLVSLMPLGESPPFCPEWFGATLVVRHLC